MPARRSDALLSQLQLFGIRLGLDRVRRLLDELDKPHLAGPVVLVAGTNGKGSTAALLANIARAAGYRTGLYTSPHLISVTERVVVDQHPITDQQLAGYLERALEAAKAVECEPPTYFEALTIAAFLYFRDQQVDLSIMEVGLGGRLDATNVSEPILSLITSISFDHEEHLGSTLEAIAREKCGVMRRGAPVITWSETTELTTLFRKTARAKGASLTLAHSSNLSVPELSIAGSQSFQLRTIHHTYNLELHLPGGHQCENASLAVLAAETMSTTGWPAFDAHAITTGVANCRWPGRLEWIKLSDGRRVLLDVAHNCAGIEALATYIAQLSDRPSLLFGALEEKTIDSVLPKLADTVEQVVLTRPRDSRSADPCRWVSIFADHPTTLETNPTLALERALELSSKTLLVCGSTYLVGEARKLLLERSYDS